MPSPRIVPTGILGGRAGTDGRDGANVLPTDVAIKQAIADPQSQTAAALTTATVAAIATPGAPARVAAEALFAPAQVPAAVARRGYFDPARSLYMPAGASMPRKLRAQIAAVRAGIAGTEAKLAWVGHSEVAGFGGVPGATDPVVALRRLMATTGLPMGTGLVPLYNNTTTDARWVLTGTWNYSGGTNGETNMQQFRSATSTSATATFTSDVAGTVVDVHTFGNGGPFTVTIDGVSKGTQTPSGASAPQKISFTGLANTTHTVVIQPTTTATTYLLGAEVRPSIAAQVTNFGWYGARALGWAETGQFFSPNKIVQAYAPDFALIQLDANEAINSHTTTSFRNALKATVQAIQAVSATGLVCSLATLGGGVASVAAWDTYRSVVYDVADQTASPLIDLTHRTGGWAVANANGLQYDYTHQNAKGASEMARGVYEALLL